MAPCHCLRHNMSTRRAGRSQTPCAWQLLGSADVKAGGPNPRGAAGQPLCPRLPGLAGSRQAARGRSEGLQQRAGAQSLLAAIVPGIPTRAISAAGARCRRGGAPGPDCISWQPAEEQGAGPVSTRPRLPGAGRAHGDGTGGAGVIPIGLSIFCLACQGDAWMAEPCSASLGGRWSLPVLRPPSLHCQRSGARHLLGLPAAGMLLPFAKARGGCGNPCARAREPLLAAAKGPRKEMLLACAQPSCRLWK